MPTPEQLKALRRRLAWLEGYLATTLSESQYWPTEWRGHKKDGGWTSNDFYPPWDENVEWEKRNIEEIPDCKQAGTGKYTARRGTEGEKEKGEEK